MPVASSSITSVKVAHNLDFRHTASGCICTDTCLQWDKVVANRLGSCRNRKYKLLCGHGGRLCFSAAWRAYVIFQSCCDGIFRGCDYICLPDSFARYSAAGGNQEMDRMALFQTYSGSSAGCLWFLGWGVPSTAVSLVARRDKEDKWNGRAFQAFIQATVARWFWFPDWVSPLFLWLPEGTMKVEDMAKCFIALIQSPVSSLF